MYRVFIIYKPKKLIVTKELDREIRKEYSSFELLNTYKSRKGLKKKVENLALRYKIDDIDYRAYIPGDNLIPINTRPIEEQKIIRSRISAGRKGVKMSEEWKRKISASIKGIKRHRTPAEKLMYASFRSKLGYKYRWIVNMITGEKKQLPLGLEPPSGWIFRRASGLG